MKIEKANRISPYFTVEFGDNLSFYVYETNLEDLKKLILSILEAHPKKVLEKKFHYKFCLMRIKERPYKKVGKGCYAERILRDISPLQTYQYLLKELKKSNLKIYTKRVLPKYVVITFDRGEKFKIYEESFSKVASFVKTIFEKHPKNVFQKKPGIYTQLRISKLIRKEKTTYKTIYKNLYGITPQEASNFFYENSKKMTPEMCLNNEWFPVYTKLKEGTRVSFEGNLSKTFPSLSGEEVFTLLINVFTNHKKNIFENRNFLPKIRVIVRELSKNTTNRYSYVKEKKLANITSKDAYNYFVKNYKKYV